MIFNQKTVHFHFELIPEMFSGSLQLYFRIIVLRWYILKEKCGNDIDNVRNILIFLIKSDVTKLVINPTRASVLLVYVVIERKLF